jgi:predicted nucleic acid-binding protein
VITAVDSNVLLDVFANNAEFARRSASALRRCIAEGSLIACEVVWAETGSWFPDVHSAKTALSTLRVAYSPVTEAAALAAGRSWQEYRKAGGPRERVIADFLIGNHASVQADRLLTRDRGFYRSHFTELSILDPSDEPKESPESPTGVPRG